VSVSLAPSCRRSGASIITPTRFRLTSVVHHLEAVGFRSVPIIALISFLVGCIVAQQGIFQLRKFGATAFVVDLTGILTLRELGVLLTSIMIAGRSGSAFTAEIGSMKMREEIDALRVMRLDPIEVLVGAAHPGTDDRAAAARLPSPTFPACSVAASWPSIYGDRSARRSSWAACAEPSASTPSWSASSRPHSWPW